MQIIRIKYCKLKIKEYYLLNALHKVVPVLDVTLLKFILLKLLIGDFDFLQILNSFLVHLQLLKISLLELSLLLIDYSIYQLHIFVTI